jgi:hypothetical protein
MLEVDITNNEQSDILLYVCQDSESVEQAVRRVTLAELANKKMLADLKYRNPEFDGRI